MNWKQKLSSRKFWAAVAAFAVSVCALFGVDTLTVEHITALIGAVGIMMAYIIGESCVDASRNNDNSEK